MCLQAMRLSTICLRDKSVVLFSKNTKLIVRSCSIVGILSDMSITAASVIAVA